MTHFTIRQGARSVAHGAPQTVETVGPISRAGLLGADFPGLRPTLNVAEGDLVRQGQAVVIDRRQPEIVFAAPIAGRIAQIAYGPRRTLSSLIIERDREAADAGDTGPVDSTTPEGVRSTLLARGFWPAFRTRPFGVIPAPDAEPQAIFVNAVGAGTHRPDPALVLDGRTDDFRQGLAALARLTGGIVHLCQDQGAVLCPDLPDRVRLATFSGRHAAALPGTHIHRLHPVGQGVTVWTIGYQDVAAIGRLLLSGLYDSSRVVSLAGPFAARPRLVRTHLGADLRALTAGDARPSARGAGIRIVSGDAVSGRPAAFLRRYHDEVTIVAAADQLPSGNGHPRALIPTAALDGALPFAILTVPLMRALAVGDVEAAERLGCLALVEEDVALLSRRCTSGADYGVLLRGVLDELARDTQ